MMLQLAEHLVKSGADPRNILYASIDTPIYSRMALEEFLDYLPKTPEQNPSAQYYVLLDEVQYLANWEVHLKDLVDNHANVKFVVSGSAAAALRLASAESGAGRFSDFRLPPLTFAEFLQFVGKEEELVTAADDRGFYETSNVTELNAEFINYLNYGGYPEAVLSQTVRNNTDQFVRNDIIDKVLLKDLPALYGIQNIQELNSLFAHLAYNNGNEISLTSIANKSGANRETIGRYLTYLESAFLVQKVSRVDQNAKKFQRERQFKIYLTNPSMRAALIAPAKEEDSTLVGQLAEAAAFSQWSHNPTAADIYYARWKEAEIDMMFLEGVELKPRWAVELKWSDRGSKNPSSQLKGLKRFFEEGKLKSAYCTTKTVTGETEFYGGHLQFIPTSIYCYMIGKNLTRPAEKAIIHPSSTPK